MRRAARDAGRGALAAWVITCAVGCSHTVVIDSEPTGADIAVNGEPVGVAPVLYVESTGWRRAYEIEARLPGFAVTQKRVHQSEWSAPVLIGTSCASLCLGTPLSVVGALPIVGIFWAQQLPDRVVVPLRPRPAAPAPMEPLVDERRSP